MTEAEKTVRKFLDMRSALSIDDTIRLAAGRGEVIFLENRHLEALLDEIKCLREKVSLQSWAMDNRQMGA